MTINEENKKWAAQKIYRFRDWRGFPQNPEDVDARIRSFLRLVHGKPMAEVMTAACQRSGVPFDAIEWGERANLDPAQVDADWILDLIAETMDYFPLPVQMRELYTRVLPPASTFGEAPVRED